MLLRELADELTALGLSDVTMDEHGYVMATVPATTREGRRADHRLHRARRYVTGDERHRRRAARPSHYDGRDLVLTGRSKSAVIRLAENPRLARADGSRHRHGLRHDAAGRRR